MSDDPYEVLGIERTASAKNVRSRYRVLARRYHPDVNGGDGTADWVFKRVQEAYESTQSEEARKRTATAPTKPSQSAHETGRNWQTNGQEHGNAQRRAKEQDERDQQRRYAEYQVQQQQRQLALRAIWRAIAWPAAAAASAMMIGQLTGNTPRGIVMTGIGAFGMLNLWLFIIEEIRQMRRRKRKQK